VIAFCARYVRGIGIGTIILAVPADRAACFTGFGVQLAVFWLLDSRWASRRRISIP